MCGCCDSDDDSMDVDSSHAAANMACVLNFVKKMLAIVSSVLQVLCIYGSCLKLKKLIKTKGTRKLKHANSVSESFEHLSRMSLKSILIITNCTVSKLVHFLRQCIAYL